MLTAGITGAFCRFVLGMTMLESFLLGSVISSTDAASVFYILRSRRLNLRDGTASLLELESGSNDPFAYMLTFVCLSVAEGGGKRMERCIYRFFSGNICGSYKYTSGIAGGMGTEKI